MQDRFNTGLVVGKFSPLHCGHQALIDHALSCCDRVLLLREIDGWCATPRR